MINRKIFDKVLRRMKKVLGCSPVAALRCIKLEGDGKNLTISGTSSQVSAVETIPAGFTGACCVNLKELMTALRGMNGSDISLEPAPEDGRLSIISTDHSLCSLGIFPVDEFPSIISLDQGKSCFSMAAEILALHVRQAYQGKGIGSALLMAAIGQLLESGCRSVMLWTLQGNPARRWYERLGGEMLGEKRYQVEDWEVIEVAYGWETISGLLSPGESDAAGVPGPD